MGIEPHHAAFTSILPGNHYGRFSDALEYNHAPKFGEPKQVWWMGFDNVRDDGGFIPAYPFEQPDGVYANLYVTAGRCADLAASLGPYVQRPGVYGVILKAATSERAKRIFNTVFYTTSTITILAALFAWWVQ